MKKSRIQNVIEADLERIERLEGKIEAEERKLERAETRLLERLEDTDDQIILQAETSRFGVIRASVVRRLAKHKFLYSLLVSLGVVLVWRGIWDVSGTIPFLSYPIVALAVGLLILWLTKRYSDLED